MTDRGRETFIITGRGGAGNIRSPSRGRAQQGSDLPPPAAVAAAHNPALGKGVHAGRGGAGNVRSPSRDPLERQRVHDEEVAEHKLQADYAKQEATHYHATGRGGAGNIQSSGAAANDAAPSTRGREDGAVGGTVGSILRSLSREPRSSDRRPSGGGLNERSLSRTRDGAATGTTTEVLPSVSENGRRSDEVA
ncbi:hypothetical protein V8E36_001602 [Tilletia maclaganii]